MLGVGSLRWQQLGLEAPKQRVISLLSEVGVLHKDTEEGQKSFGQVKVPPQKRRAVRPPPREGCRNPARQSCVHQEVASFAAPSDPYFVVDDLGLALANGR